MHPTSSLKFLHIRQGLPPGAPFRHGLVRYVRRSIYCTYYYCGTRRPRSAQRAQYFASTPVVQPTASVPQHRRQQPNPLVSLFFFSTSLARSLACLPPVLPQRTHHLATRPGIDSCKQHYGLLAKRSTNRPKTYVGHPLSVVLPSSSRARIVLLAVCTISHLGLESRSDGESVSSQMPNALERLPVRLPATGTSRHATH